MEQEGELEKKVQESSEQRRQREEEDEDEEEAQVLCCTVGKEAGRKWKANLQWVLANLLHRKNNNRLVFLHLHRPASRINIMGAWVPVSQLAEQEGTAYRQLEEEKVNESKVVVPSDDTAVGLVQFVHDHGVTELVMGAASDRAYHRKMREPRSKKALIAQRRTNPSCKIWFVCKGNLVCTREGESSSTTASTSPRSKRFRPLQIEILTALAQRDIQLARINIIS